MKKKTTIYDIATKLNITAATVSRALNHSELISKKTKKMVLEAADELSYFKNRHALALKSGRTNQVGLVVPFINRHFFSNIIRTPGLLRNAWNIPGTRSRSCPKMINKASQSGPKVVPT